MEGENGRSKPDELKVKKGREQTTVGRQRDVRFKLVLCGGGCKETGAAVVRHEGKVLK